MVKAIGNKVKSLDFFGQRVGFELGGRQTLNSYLGALLSVLIIAISLFYAVGRFETMLKYGDTVYAAIIEKEQMVGESLLQKDTNFNVAFQVTGLYDFDLVRKFNYSEYLQLDAYMFKGAGQTAPPSEQKL